METVAKTKQGICLKGKYVSVTGIHAENSTSKYWFALKECDPDTVSEDHLKLLCVQYPDEDKNKASDRLSFSGPGLMSLPHSIARKALKQVLTESNDREYSYLVIRDLRSTFAVADFFRIFVRDFGTSSAAVCSNSYCASSHVTDLAFRFQEEPKVWEALAMYLFNKDCWHFFQGVEYFEVRGFIEPVPPKSVARVGSGIAAAMCGSTMRYLYLSSSDCESSPGSLLPLLHSLILGASETGGKIRRLDIVHEYVSDDDGSQILALLSSNALVERLHLNCNATAEKTSESLGEFLSKPCCSIKELTVFCNLHGSDLQRKDLRHVSHIFHGLSRNTSLKHVHLEFYNNKGPNERNVVRDDIAVQVGFALRLNRTLESVELNHLVMSEKGVAILADALAESCSLSALLGVYWCTKAMLKHAEVWERCLQCNPYLVQLATFSSLGPVRRGDRRLLSVMYLLSLNRAGRRFFFLPTSTRSSKRRKTSKHPTPRLPLAVWPLLMARVSKEDVVDLFARALGICPADMIYRMLQDGPIFREG